MSSSSSSIMCSSYYFTKRLYAAALLYTVLCIAGTEAARRWETPCAGQNPTKYSIGKTSHIDVVISKCNNLKRHVHDIKEAYVRDRLRDALYAEELVNTGFILEGIPSIKSSDPLVSSENGIEKIYEDLARYAVFIQHARLEENRATNERLTFARSFEVLEDDPEHGLYGILCVLQVTLNRPVKLEILQAIRAIEIKSATNNATRHIRDYIVLVGLEKFLDRIVSELARE